MATGVLSAVGRIRRARFTSRLWLDLGALTALCAGVTVLAVSPQILDFLQAELAVDVLTLVAAGVGTGTAILALVGSRLLGETRLAWLAAALVMYCAVVLPWSMGTTNPTTAERAARLLAYATALVLLLFALRAPRRMGTWGGWVIMLGGWLLIALAWFLLPDVGPVTEVLSGPVTAVVVVVGWNGAAVLAVVDAVRIQSGPRLRAGLGLVVIAGAQLYRLADSTRTPATDLVFPALRLVGLVVLLVGLMQIVGSGLRKLQEQNFVQQEELAVAALHMERAAVHTAEKNHELRNGLAGLAGITHLLSAEVDGPDQERLRRAVLAELGRLHTLLESSADPRGEGFGTGTVAAFTPLAAADDPAGDGTGDGGEEVGYLVEPMLDGLVALQRARDRDVTAEVVEGLRARGSSAVAAQIITNLLANCERHAPGTPVRITALSEQDRVVIEVRDQGPGLPRGHERAVLVRGVRDVTAGGSGLGLHISRELAEGQGGTLGLRTVADPGGCAATITLPAGVAERPATDRIAQ